MAMKIISIIEFADIKQTLTTQLHYKNWGNFNLFLARDPDLKFPFTINPSTKIQVLQPVYNPALVDF